MRRRECPQCGKRWKTFEVGSDWLRDLEKRARPVVLSKQEREALGDALPILERLLRG